MNTAFSLGRIVTTCNAEKTLSQQCVLKALLRHKNCDWGDLRQEDKDSNDEALELGDRLFSVYHDVSGTKFWIITEADRSATTILLPEDY